MNYDEIQEIIKSAVSQAVHLQPSPETLTRMSHIEEMIRKHAEDETDILRNIQSSVASIIQDQAIKHSSIETQLAEMKPIRDGLVAASTIRNGVLWMSGFLAGILALIYYGKQVLK